MHRFRFFTFFQKKRIQNRYLVYNGFMNDSGNMADISDSRRFLRRHLLYYLQIIDAKSDEAVGRLGDINTGGVLMLTDREFSIDKVIPIAIVIPKALGMSHKSAEMTVRTRWCRPENRKGHFAVGCSIEKIDAANKKLIPELIEKIGFSDGSKKIYLKNDQNIFQDPTLD